MVSSRRGLYLLIAFSVIILIVLILSLTRSSEDVIQDVSFIPVDTPPIEQTIPVIDASVSGFEEVELVYPENGAPAGIARRGEEDGHYVLVVVGDLPTINREVHFYEGWLVTPGITDYFSVGELFSRDDGKWALVFEEDPLMPIDEIDTFTRVVITREIIGEGGDPSPYHMAEACFGGC